MKLTPIEIKHLLYLLKVNEGEVWHKKHEKRAWIIVKKLEAELRYIKEIKREAKI